MQDLFHNKRFIKKCVFFVVGVVAAFALYFILTNNGIDFQQASVLAILLCAIFWWSGSVFPNWATAIAMGLSFATIAGVGFETATKSFAGSTWWLLVAAFGIAGCMTATGLLHRFALNIIKLFPNTYVAQILGFMIAGSLVGPFIPSLAAKASILTPVAYSVGKNLGFDDKS
ncbi:MAG: anion permease, partial [Coriobacteriales bacterium]|nr:anion permease [Coriobacteriales bacterium]